MTTSRRHPTTARDRGSVSLELAIVFPALLLIVTALIQYALWFHARSLALAAAQQGVSVARAYHSTPAAGRGSALAFIAEHGADTLLNPDATTSTPATGQVQVIVTGWSVSVLPGVAGIAVSQSAAGPLERFTTAGAR
jgi:Flp pilus assembly protein TadG